METEILQKITKELDRLANLYNKTNDKKYKDQWYKLLDKLSEYFKVDIDFFIKPLEDNGLTTIKRREHDHNNNRTWPQDRV